MSAQPSLTVAASASPDKTKTASRLDGAIAAFGASAALAILFNAVLAWVKDSALALNAAMASLTGHHCRTHGALDVSVFPIFGVVLMMRGFTIRGGALATLLAFSVIVAGAGLAGRFVLS